MTHFKLCVLTSLRGGKESRKGVFTLTIQIIFRLLLMQGAPSMRSLYIKMKAGLIVSKKEYGH